MKKETVEEKVEEKKDVISPDSILNPKPRDLFFELHNSIINGNKAYSVKLKELHETITSKTAELEQLKILVHKYEGAIEATDYFIKAALPSKSPTK